MNLKVIGWLLWSLWIGGGVGLKEVPVSENLYDLVTGSQRVPAKKLSGKILRVIDGDTFVFQTAEGSLKVRLDGIDAPELKQPFGLESSSFLKSYLYKKALLESKGVDRYGRTLGVLFVEGSNINLQMVEKGYAWHFKKYSHNKALAKAEVRARKAKLGLWRKGTAVAPWEWRSMQKQKKRE